jgi:hypothetical protein
MNVVSKFAVCAVLGASAALLANVADPITPSAPTTPTFEVVDPQCLCGCDCEQCFCGAVAVETSVGVEGPVEYERVCENGLCRLRPKVNKSKVVTRESQGNNRVLRQAVKTRTSIRRVGPIKRLFGRR